MDRTLITDMQGLSPAVGDARALVVRTADAAMWQGSEADRMRFVGCYVHPTTPVTKRHNGISTPRPLEVST
jgi:hypothetical protein